MDQNLLPPHGGYKNLKSYQNAEIVYDATVVFCRRFLHGDTRTIDQMVQAARSGKQNIVEGSQASATSRKTELKLTGVARASMEELLEDYQDFLRQHGFRQWTKDDPEAQAIRKLAYRTNRTYTTYRTYIEERSAEVGANTVISLIHQTNYLLDQQLRYQGKQFLEKGGFTESLYRLRQDSRNKSKEI